MTVASASIVDRLLASEEPSIRLNVSDERCADALDLLESKRLPDGGWPAEGRFYGAGAGRRSLVDRGGANRRRANEWVTADALTVLAAAGRLEAP